MAGGLMGIGKSKARRYNQEQDTKVTFDDVAGIDEVERELVEIVDLLELIHRPAPDFHPATPAVAVLHPTCIHADSLTGWACGATVRP